MWDDNILLGEMAYNLLACEANQVSDERFIRVPGFTLPEDAYTTMDFFSQPYSPASYTASPYTTYVLIWCTLEMALMSPPRSDLSPQFSSPSPSETSPTTGHRQTTSGPSCRNATAEFCHIREKWYCNMCNKDFSRKCECKRHIENSGKRAKCVACRSELYGRGDSLQRHFRSCKLNTGHLMFEDAFVNV